MKEELENLTLTKAEVDQRETLSALAIGAQLIIDVMIASNIDEFSFTLGGVHNIESGNVLGDYTITVKRDAEDGPNAVTETEEVEVEN